MATEVVCILNDMKPYTSHSNKSADVSEFENEAVQVTVIRTDKKLIGLKILEKATGYVTDFGTKATEGSKSLTVTYGQNGESQMIVCSVR